MKLTKMFLQIALLVFCVVYASGACCSEASTIIQIKNYEGPIYLHAPHKTCEEQILHRATKTGCDFDCTCVSKPVSTCIPINTASQCTGYNVPYPLYQDTCVNTPCTGLYNVPTYPLYQDSLYYPNVYCSVPQDDCSYACGRCGKKYTC